MVSLVYMDDIFITGPSTSEHLKTLGQVLTILSQNGLRLNRDKCFFLRSKVEYLGHIIDAKGLHPTEDKIKAIKNALPSHKRYRALVLPGHRELL